MPSAIRAKWKTLTDRDNHGYGRRVLRSFLKRSGLGFLWAHFWVTREEPKIILDNGLLIVLSRTAFHFVALAMTAVLTWLHSTGFYIGGALEGWHDHSSEAVKQLLIQIAAKTLELIVIGSLTTIVVDVVRSFLINQSIPLGLLTAHLQFSNPRYFISEDFWASFNGFRNKLHFLSVAALLMLCGAMALLTGPATAVLLIPVWRPMWYAGGTSYWLAGGPSTLWPQHLTINDIGTGWASENCRDPPAVDGTGEVISLSGCVWAGHGGLRANYADSHQQQIMNLTLTEGFQARLLVSIQNIMC